LFTDSGRADLINTAKSVVNVLDGASELAVSNLIGTGGGLPPGLSPLSSGNIALIDRTIQSAPFLSADIKDYSTAITHQVLSDTKNIMQGFANLFEWK
jgi:hypothetical protein